jgi:hypothetical protein
MGGTLEAKFKILAEIHLKENYENCQLRQSVPSLAKQNIFNCECESVANIYTE